MTMANHSYYKEIIRLGLPILVGQLGMIVTAFADNIMVGRYSTEALASASFVNGVFNVAFSAVSDSPTDSHRWWERSMAAASIRP